MRENQRVGAHKTSMNSYSVKQMPMKQSRAAEGQILSRTCVGKVNLETPSTVKSLREQVIGIQRVKDEYLTPDRVFC